MGWYLQIIHVFFQNTNLIYYHQLLISCGGITGHSGENLTWRERLLNPNFFSCTDLCSSLNRMGWWQSLPWFPTWTLRCQMMYLISYVTKFKYTNFLLKIIFRVNTWPRRSWGTYVSCPAQLFLFGGTEDRAHADQIKSNLFCFFRSYKHFFFLRTRRIKASRTKLSQISLLSRSY